MDFQKAIDAVKNQKSLILSRISLNTVTEKGHFDYVTNVDVEIEKNLQKALKTFYPSIPFWGEEGEKPDLRGSYWLLDPIDGTTNYIHDYKCSVISLALVNKGEVVFGVIYNPYFDELFTAEKGKGSFCNGIKISVSKNLLEKSLISFGTTPYDRYLFSQLTELLKIIFPDVQDLRRSGSAAYDLALVASGRTDGYFELILRPWDFAAGILLVKEAGGKVTTCNGNILRFDTPISVLATNGKIHPFLVAKMRGVFHD